MQEAVKRVSASPTEAFRQSQHREKKEISSSESVRTSRESTLDINFVILMSHSGHITGRSIISSFLRAPLGDLISMKCWRSLSNGRVLLLSVCHWFLTPKGHGGIISYFRDQSPGLMTGSCHSPRAQTAPGTRCLSPAKTSGCL